MQREKSRQLSGPQTEQLQVELNQMEKFWAHTGHNRPPGSWDPLAGHLESVARRTSEFSSSFGPWAGHLVGLWHDIGKYQADFQRYLLGEVLKGPEHAIVGAYHAFRQNRVDLAMVIAAHHGSLDQRAEFLNKIERGAAFQYLAPPELLTPRDAERAPVDAEALWIRFLFSALVDADSLETEYWDKAVRRWRCETTVAELAATLEQWLAEKTGSSVPSAVNELRRTVQQACAERAADAMGAFRLTVPTGGGKTLASLLFALRHAQVHGLRRVIVVIPYTSIIDQTVKVFRSIFGDDAVLEHHSNIDPDGDSLVNRRCVENWDSPVIVTTSVQFFETLHANRKRDLRKLHRVAESVVILDEVQTFPLELIKPIKASLDRLVAHFHVTTVHCSATQPRLAQADAREIVPDFGGLFSGLGHRVNFHWPGDIEAPVSWQGIAENVRRQPEGRVLVIVHRKRDAIDLALALGGECLHLSTLMCPAHRRAVLARIEAKLQANEPCIVVSTQLVEAGVDLDFPVVYRAMAGVDSLIQAAGRCNREGGPVPGDFHIFVAPSDPPRGTLLEGLKQVRTYLKRGPVDLNDPELPAKYFKAVAQFRAGTSAIPERERHLDFPEVERLFRMIPDYGTPVIAPHGDRWLEAVESAQQDPGIQNFRKLQPYTVSLPDTWLNELKSRGCLVPLFAGSEDCWYVLPGQDSVYSAQFGFGGDGTSDLPFLEV